MSIDKLLLSFRVITALATPIYAGCDAAPGTTAQYCAKDNDCKGDRLCVRGVCEGSGSNNTPNPTSGYNCEQFCYDVSDCCDTSGCQQGFETYSTCVPLCNGGLNETKKEFEEKGCTTKECQDLVAYTSKCTTLNTIKPSYNGVN